MKKQSLDRFRYAKHQAGMIKKCFKMAVLGIGMFLFILCMKSQGLHVMGRMLQSYWNASGRIDSDSARTVGGQHQTGEDISKTDEEKMRTKGIPDSLIELAKSNPEAVSFVEHYPRKHRKKAKINLSDYIKETKDIPLFIQWDERWGYRQYGGDYLAVTGCGPTCLSMVYCGLSSDGTWNPYKVAKMAEKYGYYIEGQGSAWALMTEGAGKLGLNAQEVVFDTTHILQTLEQGRPIICAMRQGDFTTTGHFIVLTGVAEDGSIMVHDPNSRIRSDQTWELERLMGQIKNLWCYDFSK